jgi:hypothetical protein
MKKPTKIKYAVTGMNKFLFTQTCGDLALSNALIMNSITFESKEYKIVKKHHDFDDDSYIFLCEEIK